MPGHFAVVLSKSAKQGFGEVTELAEGARLEIVCGATSSTQGSNPCLSASRLCSNASAGIVVREDDCRETKFCFWRGAGAV